MFSAFFGGGDMMLGELTAKLPLLIVVTQLNPHNYNKNIALHFSLVSFLIFADSTRIMNNIMSGCPMIPETVNNV